MLRKHLSIELPQMRRIAQTCLTPYTKGPHGPRAFTTKVTVQQEQTDKQHRLNSYIVDEKTNKFVLDALNRHRWRKSLSDTLQSRSSIIAASTKLSTSVIEHLMPRDYRTSVGPSYEQYAKWSVFASVAGTVSGVLSMQSLLFAMGLGAGKVPLAAALNWIIKDGLGQLGGVLYASMIHHRFDSDPKRWRFTAALVFDISILVEVLTPLFPAYFLPMASVANVGKNVGWLSASATRAGIHKTFIRKANLADVTGKAGSQSIAASVVGTALGVVLSPMIGTDPFHILAVSTGISVLHLYCTHRSLQAVVLPTLNLQRAWLATRDAFVTDASGKVSAFDWSQVKSCTDVSKDERFVHFGRWGGPTGVMSIEEQVPHGSSSPEKTTCVARVEIGPKLSQFGDGPETFQQAVQESEVRDDKHLIHVKRLDKRDSLPGMSNGPWKNPEYAVQLLFKQSASDTDITLGVLHSFSVCRGLLLASQNGHGGEDVGSIVRSTREVLDSWEKEELERDYEAALGSKGWDCKHSHLEECRARVLVE